MPIWRFLVHGTDPIVDPEDLGFYTTRHASARTRAEAERKVLNALGEEFTVGVSASHWGHGAPLLRVEEGWQIKWWQAVTLTNRGSTFYRDPAVVPDR